MNRSVIAGYVLLFSATCGLAQDWPQWRGLNRDGKAAGFVAPATWPRKLVQKWKVEVGSGDATPALVGDRLYVFARQGDDEVTLCLDAATGQERWKDKYAAVPTTGPSISHPGPRSSPAVADGKVVTLGVGGTLSCLDAQSGQVVWRNDQYKAVPKFFTATSPIIVDGMAIAHLGAEGNGVIVALDLSSGKLKWRSTGDGPSCSSPVLLTVEDSRQIVALTEKSAVGLAVADGELLWQINFPAPPAGYNVATPIVDGQMVILTVQGRGAKAIRVEKEGDGFAIKELWINRQAGVQFSTPVLKDGMLYGLAQQGWLFCVNAQTGALAWTSNARDRLGNFAAMVDGGGVMLALVSTGELIAFKPEAKQYTELARIKVADTLTFAHPVVSGNRIFLKDQNSVALLVVEPPAPPASPAPATTRATTRAASAPSRR